MSLNPQSRSDDAGGGIKYIEGGHVTTVESHTDGDGRGHVCWVKPDSFEGDVQTEILAPAHGSVTIPEEGERVLVIHRRDGEPMIIGSRYEEGETIPAYDPGERIVSHAASDSHVYFRVDGSILVSGHNGNTIELKADGTIVLNGGTNNPVTDVSTTTDNDGHVTSISLTKSSDIYIP
jgi:hypothetical protein